MRYLKCFFYLFASGIAFAEGIDPPFFKATIEHPYHFSMGAILFNEEGRIACHYYEDIFGHRDIYILMRETVENGETPIDTVHRGLKEEFGATGEPIAFLGTLSGVLPDHHLIFEKTTLYVVCQLLGWAPENRDMEDPESESQIVWVEPNELIAIMEEQRDRFPHRIDVDESEMIRRALPFIQKAICK